MNVALWLPPTLGIGCKPWEFEPRIPSPATTEPVRTTECRGHPCRSRSGPLGAGVTPAQLLQLRGIRSLKGEMPSIATWIRQCDEHWFTDIFSRHLDLTVHNARCHQVDLAQMDALLLTGGGDISLRFLRQPIP